MGGQRTKKQDVLRLLLPQNILLFCNHNEKVVIIPGILILGFVMYIFWRIPSNSDF
jgi:hypothetical protein